MTQVQGLPEARSRQIALPEAMGPVFLNQVCKQRSEHGDLSVLSGTMWTVFAVRISVAVGV